MIGHVTFARISPRALVSALARAAVAGTLTVAAAAAQDTLSAEQVSPHMGEMFATMAAPADTRTARDTLRFEPYELLDEMFLRNDVVWVMRHGPTDWGKLDIKNVEPTDCANQRVLSDQGRLDMVNLGIILAENDVLPGKIIRSEWCRNQQTVEMLLEGAALVDPDYPAKVPVETNSNLNLLLALNGAPSVGELRTLISSWTGEGYDRPLLLVTHFTNIEELLDFSVYEGEILVVDPKPEPRAGLPSLARRRAGRGALQGRVTGPTDAARRRYCPRPRSPVSETSIAASTGNRP